MMTEAEILEKVKTTLGITGNYLDDVVLMHIEEVIQYLTDAGVQEKVIYSAASVGVISRGVSDLWNYGNAAGKLSEYFMQRAIQLCYKNGADDNVQTE